MMDVITGVRILGTLIKVEYHEELDDNDHGCYIPRDKTIKICTEQCPQEMHKTLIHEICHAMLDVSRVSHFVSNKTEEAFCDLLEELSHLVRFDLNSEQLEWTYQDITPKCSDPSLRGR